MTSLMGDGYKSVEAVLCVSTGFFIVRSFFFLILNLLMSLLSFLETCLLMWHHCSRELYPVVPSRVNQDKWSGVGRCLLHFYGLSGDCIASSSLIQEG